MVKVQPLSLPQDLSIDSETGINIGTTTDKPIDIDSSTLDIDSSGTLTIDELV